MSLAAPWPLKVVIDNVLGRQPAAGLARLGARPAHGRNKMGLALRRASPCVLIAVIGAVATYIDNYYTESVGSGSRTTFASASTITCTACRSVTTTSSRPASLLSTITNDVATVQNFASSVNARHPRRPADDRRYARPHVLAQLGLRADRRRRDAVPAAVRRCASRRRSRRHSTRCASSRATSSPSSSRASSRCASSRRSAGRISRKSGWRGQPRDRRRGAQGAQGQVAAVAGGRPSSSRCARRSCCGAARR